MPDPGAQFSMQDAKRLAAATRAEEARARNLTHPEPTNARPARAFVEGFMVGALAAATDDGTTPETAWMIVWRGQGTAWSAGEKVLITNRSTSFSAAADAYLMAVEVNGELRPIGGGGTTQLVGFEIVSADNCGTCTATAIVAINFGTTPTLDAYDQFTIYDYGGCALNEPVEQLAGRFGIAAYGTRIGDGACPGLPTTGWWIMSLCGQEDGCA